MGTGIDIYATILWIRIIHVDESGDKAVLLIREIMVILMGRIGSSLLWGFDMSLGVVKQNVGGAHAVSDGIDQFLIEQDFCEDCIVTLEVVN